jgi:hypothetical protein
MPARNSRVTRGCCVTVEDPCRNWPGTGSGDSAKAAVQRWFLAERTINSSLPQSTATPSRQHHSAGEAKPKIILLTHYPQLSGKGTKDELPDLLEVPQWLGTRCSFRRG